MRKNKSLELVQWLKGKNQTLATAESLTGGLLASSICDIPGASRVFLEGIVAYSEASKKFRLDVSENDLKSHSPVSEQVCRQMAEGVKKSLGADYGISTTGVAGPDDFDDHGNPRGLFYIGIALPNETKIFCFREEGSREEIRRRATELALEMALYEIRR